MGYSRDSSNIRPTKAPLITVYTATGSVTHTFDVKARVVKVTVTGAGGGGRTSSVTGLMTGGSGGTAIKETDITETTATVIVGVGGIAAIDNVRPQGGYSRFTMGAVVVTGGGAFSTGSTTSSGGDVNLSGASENYYSGGLSLANNLGAASFWGPGNDQNGTGGTYGAGGGCQYNTTAAGDGNDGIVIVEEKY